jgi:hypothetical protein
MVHQYRTDFCPKYERSLMRKGRAPRPANEDQDDGNSCNGEKKRHQTVARTVLQAAENHPGHKDGNRIKKRRRCGEEDGLAHRRNAFGCQFHEMTYSAYARHVFSP